MPFYDVNGKVLLPEDRERRRVNFLQRLELRSPSVRTPQLPTLPVDMGLGNGAGVLSYDEKQRNFNRSMSAHIGQRYAATQHLRRIRSAATHRISLAPTENSTPKRGHSADPGRRESMRRESTRRGLLSPRPASPLVRSRRNSAAEKDPSRRPALVNIMTANEQADEEESSSWESGEDSSSEDDYEKILMSKITDKTNLTKKPELSAEVVEAPKPAFGLKIAMADFHKKITDNEGMDISTFSYLDEDDPDATEREVPAPPEEEEAPPGSDPTPTPAPPEVPIVVIPDDEEDEEEEEERRRQAQLMKRRKSKMLKKKKKKKAAMTPGDKFRRGVKTINLLIKACTTSTEQTRKNQMKFMTFSDLTDAMKEDADAGERMEELSFDISEYRANTERTLSKEAKDVLKLHPTQRTAEKLHVVRQSLCNAVEAFTEFPITMQQSLVKVGWFEKFGPKRVIIRQGHNALNFYFIISGTMVVTVARQNKTTGESYGETVAFLRKGQSFGELALMYGGKRSATVSAKGDVELLAVSRDDFIDIFMNLSTDTEPEHIELLRQLPILNEWPIGNLPYDDPRICMFTYFRRGTVLCRDSNVTDWIYIIKTGHCRILKDLPAISSTVPKLRSPTRISEMFPVQQDETHQRYLDFIRSDSGLGGMRKPNSGNYGPKNVIHKDKKIYIQLKILGPKDVFGLEPIAFQQLGGTTGVTMVSDGAELVLISKEFFVKYVSQQYGKRLRYQCQPFPTVESLIEKLQSFYNWDAYKELYLEHVNYYMQQSSQSVHY